MGAVQCVETETSLLLAQGVAFEEAKDMEESMRVLL